MRRRLRMLWFPPYIRRLIRRVLGRPQRPVEPPVHIERLPALDEAAAIYAVTARAMQTAGQLAQHRTWLASGDAELERLLGAIERQAHASTRAVIRRSYAPEVAR